MDTDGVLLTIKASRNFEVQFIINGGLGFIISLGLKTNKKVSWICEQKNESKISTWEGRN